MSTALVRWRDTPRMVLFMEQWRLESERAFDEMWRSWMQDQILGAAYRVTYSNLYPIKPSPFSVVVVA